MGLSSAMLDRLKLDDKRIAGMAKGLREVAALPDPVGRVLDERIRPNGLKLQKISTPIGVVVIIYESRPNVTADAASLCFKSGNATILRGGKEALNSNQIIAADHDRGGQADAAGFPEHAIQVVPTTDREAIPELLSLTQYVDLCMPRGGEGLIRAVAECSKVPVIKHYKGVCHVYVDARRRLEDGRGDRAERQGASAPPSAMPWRRCWWTARSPATFLPAIGAAAGREEGRIARRRRRRGDPEIRTRAIRSPQSDAPPSRTGSPNTTITSSTCAWWTASGRRSTTSTITARRTRTAS